MRRQKEEADFSLEVTQFSHAVSGAEVYRIQPRADWLCLKLAEAARETSLSRAHNRQTAEPVAPARQRLLSG